MIAIDSDFIVIGEKKEFTVILTDENDDAFEISGTTPKVIISNKNTKYIEKDGTLLEVSEGTFTFTLDNSDAPKMRHGRNYLRVFTEDGVGDKTNHGEIHLWFNSGPNAS